MDLGEAIAFSYFHPRHYHCLMWGRQELEKMFDLTDWKQTQFYKEAKLEGKLEGKVEGKLQAKLEIILLLRRLGLTVEQISQELDLDISFIDKFLTHQNN